LDPELTAVARFCVPDWEYWTVPLNVMVLIAMVGEVPVKTSVPFTKSVPAAVVPVRWKTFPLPEDKEHEIVAPLAIVTFPCPVVPLSIPTEFEPMLNVPAITFNDETFVLTAMDTVCPELRLISNGNIPVLPVVIEALHSPELKRVREVPTTLIFPVLPVNG
jgi:hypothetical protein